MQKWKKQLLPLFCLIGVFFCPVTVQATSDTTLDLNTIDANVANNIELTIPNNIDTNPFLLVIIVVHSEIITPITKAPLHVYHTELILVKEINN